MVGGDSEDITVCDGDVTLSRPQKMGRICASEREVEYFWKK